jgi:hypothetical protein
MPWRCPACETRIRHSDTEDAPRPGIVYRCHVCRLELIVHADTQKLVVPPLPDVAPPEPESARRRARRD